MLTPQEVEERVFPKAKKGGYDMKEVDDFLDQLTSDYSELYKENAVLKRKMKVLADKITEYQETEGAMRQTLLAAQKMASQITAEAEAKRAQMLAEAEQIALTKSQEVAAQVADQEAQLEKTKRSVAEMAASIRILLKKEEELLDTIPEMEATAPVSAPKTDAADEVAAEIGSSISRIMTEEAPVEEAPVAEPEVEEAAEEPVTAEAPVETPAESVDEAPTRRLDLSELRFGRNYEIK